MIFLNAERFFVEAIESVLAQTYRDFELVLVDDGSTDGSSAIARSYAARCPERVLYTEHKDHRNLGMSASRNHGVATGRGRFISFLDADDIWLPERLGRFVTAFEGFPDAGMLYGPTLYWYSWPGSGNEDPSQDAPGRLQLPSEVLIPAPNVLRQWLQTQGGCLPGIGSLIARREAFEAIGGFESSFRGLYEDQAFLSKMAALYPVVVIDDMLDFYRQHSASCCYQGIAAGEYHPSLLHSSRHRYLVWLEEFLARRQVSDVGVWRALRRELWPYKVPALGLLINAKRAAPLWVKVNAKRLMPPALWRVLRLTKRKLRHLDARARGFVVGVRKVYRA
jgi:glycosyltransferase involved in cell wall biosynthesis